MRTVPKTLIDVVFNLIAGSHFSILIPLNKDSGTINSSSKSSGQLGKKGRRSSWPMQVEDVEQKECPNGRNSFCAKEILWWSMAQVVSLLAMMAAYIL